MRILHTSDWHLGQTFYDYDRTEEHAAFLSFLINQLQLLNVDALLIAGDIFDVANPSASAQNMFYRFLVDAVTINPELKIIIIAGNHDSAARLEAPRPMLEEFNITVVGNMPFTNDRKPDFEQVLIPIETKQKEKAWCIAVPFLRLADCFFSDETTNTYSEGVVNVYKHALDYAKSIRKPGEAIIAMGHLHAVNAELSDDDRHERLIIGGEEAIPAKAFDDTMAYVALGHLHKSQKVAKKAHIRYAGSPLPMTFSEINYKHRFILVDIKGEEVSEVQEIEIPKTVSLLRVPNKPKTLDEVLNDLQELPDKLEDSEELPPFLEVLILQNEPLPGLKNQIETCLKNKHVRLAKITLVSEKSDGKQEKALTFEDLQKMEPIDLLKKLYKTKYETELPDNLHQLFVNVVSNINS